MNTTDQTNVDRCNSRAVAWWPVLCFVADVLGVEPAAVPDHAQHVPVLGTPAWCALPDDAPGKLAGVLHGGIHHALRLDVAQEARAEASQALSAATDWRAVAGQLGALRAWREKNPWARRVTA